MVKNCFRPQKQGAVVAVLSEAMGNETRPAASKMGAYVTAKFGLQGVVAAAAAEFSWLKAGTVSPGFTETPMLKAFDERFLETVRQTQPEGRFATPEEVAAEIMEILGAVP